MLYTCFTGTDKENTIQLKKLFTLSVNVLNESEGGMQGDEIAVKQ